MWFQIQMVKPLSPNLNQGPSPLGTFTLEVQGRNKKKEEENNHTRISPVENPTNNKTNDNIFTLIMKALQAIALFEEFLRLFAVRQSLTICSQA